MTQPWESGMNACGLALSQITYLIASLTKKNNKSSIVELNQLVERHGEEAEKHKLHTLFSQVEFSSDGKSTGKDFHQTQILIQEANKLLLKPNFIGVLCYATQGTLRPSPSLFPSLVKVLRLSPLNEMVFALALSQSPDQEVQKQAIAVLDSRICNVLRQFLKDGDVSIRDLPVHVVYYAISHVQKVNNIPAADKEMLIEHLRAVFPIDNCPIILVPLLHSTTVYRTSLHSTPTHTNLETDPHNLPELIKECGYSCCDSVDELQGLFNVIKSEITARTVAKTLGMMIQTPKNNTDEMISLQNINSSLSWSDKTEPSQSSSWNIENLIFVISQKVPHLDWREVIIELDYPEFFVHDVHGLNFILKAYNLATTEPFPTTAIYRMWANVKGQLSWIKHSLSPDSDFSFTKNLGKQVELEILKSPPEEGMPEVQIREVWTSLDLIETLLNIGECGERGEVINILSTPAKLCPDILMLGLLQSKCNWHTLQDDMIRSLLQTFLGNHPNSAIILHYCWSGPQNRQATLQKLMLNAMCDYYMHDQSPTGQVDQTRLSRILDVAQDLKTLSQLLHSPNFLFVIELAVLASRREYLKLDKWLTDKLVKNLEPFVRATITYLKRKLENDGPKNHPLPQETILSILHCLQRVLQQSSVPDGFPISQEVKDHIHHLVTSHLPPASMLPNNNTIMSGSNSLLASNTSISSILPPSNTMLPNTNSMSNAILPTNNTMLAASNQLMGSSNTMLGSSNSMLGSNSNIPNMLGSSNSMMGSNSNIPNMLASSNSMMGSNSNIPSMMGSTNSMMGSTNSMMGSTNSMMGSNNGMSNTNLLSGGLGGMSGLQSKLPQLLNQTSSPSTPVSMGMTSMTNGLGSVLGGGITQLQGSTANNGKHLLQHYGQQQSSSPPMPDSSFSAVVAQQQRRTSLSQPSNSILSSGLGPSQQLGQQNSMSNVPGIGQSQLQQQGQSLLSQGNLQQGQSLLSQGNLQNHMNLGSSSRSPQSSLGQQNIFQQNKMNLGQSGFGGSSLGNIGQNSLSSHLSNLTQNNMNPSIGQSGFNALGQQGLGQHGLGQQGLGQQGLGQQVLGQQVLGQQGMNPSNHSFMGNFDQSYSNMNQNQYPKDIEDEANSYFQQIIISKNIPINAALDMLKRFNNSSDKREKDVFDCMLHALFEEYKFYNQYPESELKITGKLFGGIIERGLVTFLSLGYALRIILDSLSFLPGHKMYMFGINAIEEFKHKLKDYPQYCRYLKEKNPHYKDFPPRLLEYLEHGVDSQEPPSAKFQPNPAAMQQTQQGFGGGMQQSSFQSMFGTQSNYNQTMGMFGQQSNTGNAGNLFNSMPPSSSPHNPSQIPSFNLQSILNNSTKSNIGSSLGNIGSSLGGMTNNFTLPPASSPSVMPHQNMQPHQPQPHQQQQQQQPQQGRSTPIRTATPQGWQQPELQPQDDKKAVQEMKIKHQPPPEGVQDKILFIFNNISQDNINQKAEEWLEIVEQQFYPWAAQYLITERVSIEPNFHELYMEFVERLNTNDYSSHVLAEVYHNIKVLLKSPTMNSNNTNEKSFLKNLGSFLGLYTLGRNRPILQIDLDLKSLVIESLHKGQITGAKQEQEYLLITVPFVCNVMRAVLHSKVFAPPNAWTMGLLGLLLEIHNLPDLKLALKFEMELLLKDLHTEMSAVPIKGVLQCDNLKEKYRVEQLVSLSVPKAAPMMPPQSYTPTPLQPGTPPQQHNMPAMMQQQPNEMEYTKIRINNQLPLFQKRPELTHCVQTAIESAITKLSGVVVKKSIDMTLTTAENIIKKDFALDPEESKMRLAAQCMVRDIAANAVLIYARDQLHSTIKENLVKSFIPNMKGIQDAQIVQEAWEAAKIVADDNLNLACIRLQADTVRQAFKEIDKRLEKEYRKRFDCRKEGQRFTNPAVAAIQDQLPEQLKLQQGGCTPQQFKVYQQYGKNIPGSLPMPSALPTIPSISSQFPLHTMDKWSSIEQQGVHDLELTGDNMAQQFDLSRGSSGSTAGIMNNRMTSFFQQHNNFGAAGDRSIDEISRMMMYKQQQQQQQQQQAQQQQQQQQAQQQQQQQQVQQQHMNTAPQQQQQQQQPVSYQNDELTRWLDSVHNKLESLQLQFPAGKSFLHPTLDKLLKTITSAKFNSADYIRLIMISVEGILECHRPEVMEKEADKAKILCEAQLFILKFFSKSNVFGKGVLQKHATKAVTEAREEIKYNEHAIDLMIKNKLILVKDFCTHLAVILHERIAIMPYSLLIKNHLFTMQINLGVNICNKATKSGDLFREEDVKQLKDVLRYFVQKTTESGQNEDPKIREEVSLQVTSRVKLIIQEWITICQNKSGEHHEQHVVRFANQIQQCNEETKSHLFKMYAEYIADTNFNNYMQNKGYVHKMREEIYNFVDSFVQLVHFMMKFTSEQNKLKLLNNVLKTVKMVLQKDHDTRKTQFLVLPYHRFFAILFQDVTANPMPYDKLSQILAIFCDVYLLLQPNAVSGFTYAWLELISQRQFLNKLLTTENKSQPGRGWHSYQQLLIALFKFLYPFLRNAELIIKNEVLYKGTLRCLLVLLHDFPEFLCDYHFPFCDVIPPGCLQLRNIILSAFPSTKSLPDPFSKDLKVDQLESITESPRMSYDYTAAIPITFKKDLDSYLQSRTPVTFLIELHKHLKAPQEEMSRVVGQGETLTKLETGSKYNIPLMNSLVLYVGVQAIELMHTNRHTPTQTTIAQGAHMDIFQNLAVDLDNEGRYLFLNAICNQLRYPNTHTHYFSCTLLYLFAEGNSEKLREQITRILLERLCVNRPHPWGLLITFIELIKNHDYHFWDHDFVTCAPEIENLFKSVFSNLQSKTNASLNSREDAE